MNNWTEFKISNIIIEQSKSKLQVQNAIDHGSYPFFTSGERVLKHTEYITEGDNIFLATGGVANVKYYSGKCAYSTDTYVLKCKDFDTKYFYYFLLEKRDFINDNLFSGSGLKHLQKKDFYKICFKAPVKTGEQQKIAKILSTTDTVIEKTQAAIAKYKAIKQGMLHDLFTRGIDIKTDKLRPKQEDVPELYKESEFGWIPKEWDEKKIVDICSMKSGEGITSKFINQFDEFPVYGGNGLRGFTSRHTHEGEFVLIGRQGALCGNINIAKGKFFASEHAVVVTPVNEINLDWLFHQLEGKNLNQYSEASAQPGLSVNKILKLPIIIPQIKEQNIIGERLLAINSKLFEEQNYLQKINQIKLGLMSDLLSGKKVVNE